MPLSSSYLFKGLYESQLQKLNAAVREIKIQKGQWLFQEGKSADRMYVLKSGAVEKLTRVNDDFELPMPCGGKLILRHVCVPASGYFEDLAL